MEHRAGEFARDLVHIRDHEQQTLGGGEGGGQCTGLERAVHCSGGAALGLHLNHRRNGSPQVFPCPWQTIHLQIHPWWMKGDGVNCDYFT